MNVSTHGFFISVVSGEKHGENIVPLAAHKTRENEHLHKASRRVSEDDSERLMDHALRTLHGVRRSRSSARVRVTNTLTAAEEGKQYVPPFLLGKQENLILKQNGKKTNRFEPGSHSTKKLQRVPMTLHEVRDHGDRIHPSSNDPASIYVTRSLERDHDHVQSPHDEWGRF